MEQHEIAAIFLVAADAFVIVQKVTAAEKDQASTTQLDCLRMVGRVAVNDIDAFINEPPPNAIRAAGFYNPSFRPSAPKRQ